MLHVNSRTLCLVNRKPLDNTPIRNQPRNNGVVISGCKPLVYLNALKPCTIRDLLFLSLYLLDCFYGEFSSLGIWLIKCYFGLRPSSLQTALWDITQHFMLAWVSSPQGTPSDQSKCAPSLGRLTRRNRSLTDIFQEFQVQVQQKESGLFYEKSCQLHRGLVGWPIMRILSHDQTKWTLRMRTALFDRPADETHGSKSHPPTPPWGFG